MNFPFQPVTGNHTSILMSESAVGFNVAATRQNAGSERFGWKPGTANAPASTCAAVVIVVSGSASFPSSAHDPPGACTPLEIVESSTATSAADGIFISAVSVSN